MTASTHPRHQSEIRNSPGPLQPSKAGSLSASARVDARDLLKLLVEHAPGYTYGEVNGQLIIYPDRPAFQRQIERPSTSDSRRYAVLFDFLRYLRNAAPEFRSWLGPMAFGTNSGDPLISAAVQLPERGTVVEHLANIAGRDGDYVFHVSGRTQYGPGVWVVGFEQVQQVREIRARLTSPRLRVGDTGRLSVEAISWDGATHDASGACAVKYGTSLPDILEVGAGGEVRAKGVGLVVLRVSAWGSLAYVPIRVEEPPK